MAFDPYSLCPGGRVKKIRFCCSDMIKEIDQIGQMIATKQFNACLALIETLEKNFPERACLTAAKLSVYRAENKWEEVFQLAKVFYEKEPENPIAVSEYAVALVVCQTDFKLAVSVLIDGFEHSPPDVTHSSLINAALQVGSCLLVRGLIVPVIALSNQLRRFPSAQNPANDLLFRASSMVKLPILLRDMVFNHYCPDQFPQKQEFMDAMELIGQLRWKQALAKLESLTQYDTIWPAIWQNVAAVRFWLLENTQACDALKKFTALSNTPLEDAADAESTRIFMTENILGDQTQIFYFEYGVTDAEAVYDKMRSNPIFFPVTVDLSEENATTVHPKGGFLLLDRPFPPPETPITFENVSSQLALILVFGKETDQDARFVVTNLYADDQLKVEHFLKETLGDFITELVLTQNIHRISRSKMMVQPRFVLSHESMKNLKNLETDYLEHVFINNWCTLPLELFDGKTPNEVAFDPVYRIRLLGLLQVIEFWLATNVADVIIDLLRTKLGLPVVYEPIVIPSGTDEEMMATLENYPVWRWHRFEVEKLPTAFLIEGLKIVATMQERRAIKKFAQELLNRPINTMPFPVRELAFETLILITQKTDQLDVALEWIEKAKQEAALNNSPDAIFFLHEISIRLELGQIQKFSEAVNYLFVNYGQDEKVMLLLRNIFIQFGIMNSDGTPNNYPLQNTQQIIQAELPPEHNKLWTPEFAIKDQPPAKLWTPE
ncbi:MAG: hypothetical protein LBC20_07325 [Planctomycetaceae bacterium]|jgi:hypothetical protein|nr:hypothetical protein [Planctomycetaceae bacterium]